MHPQVTQRVVLELGLGLRLGMLGLLQVCYVGREVELGLVLVALLEVGVLVRMGERGRVQVDWDLEGLGGGVEERLRSVWLGV